MLQKTPERPVTLRLTAGLIALLSVIGALASLATNVTLPSFPAIGDAVGVATRELGVTRSSFFITFGLGQLVIGPLSDRIGRYPLLWGGLLTFAIGNAIAAGATYLSVLVVGHVVQALGVCAASVLSRAIARDLFEGYELARVLSFATFAIAVALGFSPLLGAAVDAVFGWRAIFLMVGAATVVVAIAYRAWIGETLVPHGKSPASLTAVVRGYGALLVDMRFLAPALTVGLIIGGIHAFFAAAPVILIDGFGLSPLGLSVFLAATVVAFFSGGLLAPYLSLRIGQAQATLLGAVLAFIGSVPALVVAGNGFPLIWYILSLMLFHFGMGLTYPLGTALALQPFGNRAGLASALLGFLQMCCASIATTAITHFPLPAATAIGLVLVVYAGLCLCLTMSLSRRSALKA